MKTLLVTSTNLYLTPYIKSYLAIDRDAFDIVYWDRHCLDERDDSFTNTYSLKTKNYKETDSKFRKLFYYFKFIKYVKKVVLKNKYTKIIFLQSSIAVLLTGFLKKNFKNKYIVDIRDYTFEKYSYYRRLEKKNFENAYALFISSEGFKNFLPNYKYYNVHNYSRIDDSVKASFLRKERYNKPIRLSFIGLVRFFEQNKRIIDYFANDERFSISFIGKGSEQLKEHIVKNNINNVRLVDYFDPSETINYYKDTDFIINLYGNHTPLLDYALSNKLYFAANLYLPILVCPDTFMEELSIKYGFGISIDLNNVGDKEKILNFWDQNNLDSFVQGCNLFIENVKEDMKKYVEVVRGFLDV